MPGGAERALTLARPALSLRPRFDALWSRAVAAGDPARPWGRLDAGYGDPGRAYHGWAHVAAMLADLDAASAEPDFAQNLADARIDEVELAVFFHDAVYDPRRADNEAASAALFAEEAGPRPVIDGEGVRRVRALILATAEHRPSPDPATRLLIDLDLAVLGAEPGIYADYARAIRREYAHVPDAAWRFGRGAVLRRFLDRERIFSGASFARRFEARARANLAGELAALEA